MEKAFYRWHSLFTEYYYESTQRNEIVIIATTEHEWEQNFHKFQSADMSASRKRYAPAYKDRCWSRTQRKYTGTYYISEEVLERRRAFVERQVIYAKS